MIKFLWGAQRGGGFLWLKPVRGSVFVGLMALDSGAWTFGIINGCGS